MTEFSAFQRVAILGRSRGLKHCHPQSKDFTFHVHKPQNKVTKHQCEAERALHFEPTCLKSNRKDDITDINSIDTDRMFSTKVTPAVAFRVKRKTADLHIAVTVSLVAVFKTSYLKVC